jgi:hypothetical protein
MDATPNPTPAPSAVPAQVPPPLPVPTAAAVGTAPALVFKPAPDGMTCKVCNAPLRYGTEGKSSQEFVCSTLKDDAPILADKYEEWRNHFIGSRVVKSK